MNDIRFKMNIPLKVLIADPSDSSEILFEALNRPNKTVLSLKRVSSLSEANSALLDRDINTIFIDPILLSLEAASSFIFETRIHSPGIVFVLYLDFAQMEYIRHDFFSGERRRFKHYFKVDKLTPIAAFPGEINTAIRKCQQDLSVRLTEKEISELQRELDSLKTVSQGSASRETAAVPIEILQKIQDQLDSIKGLKEEQKIGFKPKLVFLSYRFAETDYIDGLKTLLEREKFSVTTGQDANTFISQAIIERIKLCEFFVCLMTRADEKIDGTYTTSPWLLEEKGAAIALDKRIVLMVEDGVKDIGGLQGDWQRIDLTAKSFTIAAIKAVDQLKSYSE